MSDLQTQMAAYLTGKIVETDPGLHAAQIMQMMRDLHLALIDPEDRNAIERELIYARPYPAGLVENIQQALRAFWEPRPVNCTFQLVIGSVAIPCERKDGHLGVHAGHYGGTTVSWS